MRARWSLDPEVAYLNHGSFGACPTEILAVQREFSDRLEHNPMQFCIRELAGLADGVRETLAEFLDCEAADLALVKNATTGVNTVLRSLRFEAGDELLVTDHGYNACRNALEHVAQQSGARVVVVRIALPTSGPDAVVEAVLREVGPRTKLALLDHVTSPTGLVLPIVRLVEELTHRGVDTLVDGAHAPGMLPLSIRAVGAAYYTGNCHKWLCTPKGAAFLHVRADRQAELHPLCISHGRYAVLDGSRSRFRAEFDYTGTDDPTAHLCIPAAIELLKSLVPGGMAGLMRRNHELVLRAHDAVCKLLGDPPALAPPGMLGSLAIVSVPDGDGSVGVSMLHADPLQKVLADRYRIEIPVVPWPRPPTRRLRLSAQAYNEWGDYERLLAALEEFRGEGRL